MSTTLQDRQENAQDILAQHGHSMAASLHRWSGPTIEPCLNSAGFLWASFLWLSAAGGNGGSGLVTDPVSATTGTESGGHTGEVGRGAAGLRLHQAVKSKHAPLGASGTPADGPSVEILSAVSRLVKTVVRREFLR